MTIREYFISMNSLLSYYQKELNFLKKHGRVFAERFPKIARRLGMIEGESADPHVSRLIESFALLTSRIHQRLDEDMPEVVEALIASLAPQFLRPLPSTCIVMMEPDPARSGISGKNILAPGTALFTRNTAPLPCQFQTIYPVTLLPLSIETASLHFDSDILNWKLRLQFRVWPGGAIGAEKIRLYLHGQDNAVNLLYTVLCSELQSLGLSQGDNSIALSATAISPWVLRWKMPCLRAIPALRRSISCCWITSIFRRNSLLLTCNCRKVLPPAVMKVLKFRPLSGATA